MRKMILLISILILVGGCALKKPPVPWERIVPKRIVNLSAISREGQLMLEWTSPKENTDKTVLTDLAGFKILRSQGTLVGGECRGCGEKKEVIFEMKTGSPEEAKGRKITALIEDLEPRKVYVFEVVSFNRRGHSSSPSNPVTVYWDYSPHVPAVVKGEPGNKRVELSWEPVLDATGYNVYRREENKAFPLRPLNREPIEGTRHTDLNVENDRTYFYSVRAVKQAVKTYIEGKGSPEISVTPIDIIPPASPAGLVAIPLKNGIELNWRKNVEPDLLGYYVYRRRIGEREFKRLFETPLRKETYLDTPVELGREYEYAVSAVDNSPRRNESPLSEYVRVKYQYSLRISDCRFQIG